MACRLPGGIDSPDQLWDALLRGGDFVTKVPLDRWDADQFYDPEPGVPGRSVCSWGGFLDDIAGFDAEFFGISEREATALDPQHRLMLETSWEAIERAGIDPATLADTLTGVFLGMTNSDYQLVVADAHVVDGPYGFTGSNFSLASGRIAYALGVHGPAYTIDSACSSSLLAVHSACLSLGRGESDLALAGGVSITLDPRRMSSGSAQGMLSPTGRCHAFDVGADGFVGSEGALMLLLKRLPDAQRDGDRILAVVRGTAANHDGHTPNIATPSRDAQVAVYEAALAAAGVDARSVEMVEAHGTGTPVGDPIEFASLARVYGTESPCALTSVKTNFGHCQAASGALGLMKAVLSVQHGMIPRHLHFTRLPEEMARIDTNLYVPQATTPWPDRAEHLRRAAVSSYGLSGTNVHVIVEEAPAENDAELGRADGASSKATTPLPFVLSSSSPDELRRTAGRLADWVSVHTNGTADQLSDLSYTLARRRAHRPVRTAVVGNSKSELIDSLRAVEEGITPHRTAVGQDGRGPVWVFSGQGSQWAGMGIDLLACEAAFAETVANVEPLILRESGFSVTEAMSACETITGIDRIQPTVFTFQVALAAALAAHGVRPGAVIGHSMGEVAAAVVAEALSIEDGVKVICRRSQLLSRIAGSGAMASVDLPAAKVLSDLAAQDLAEVVVSVVASPQSTVVGGASDAVRALVDTWQGRGLMAREVAVDVASHSPQVDSILGDLTGALAELNPKAPTLPYYSATLYDPCDAPACDADYWVANLRQMVRFAAAAQAAMEDGYRVFGELAPHPMLTHAIEQTAGGFDMSVAALASVRRQLDMPHGLLDFVADLHCAGAAVDFSRFCPDGRLVDAPLPTWTHTPLLLTRDKKEQAAEATTVTVHPLLGTHVRLPEEPERHVWQGDVGTVRQPWLGDHRVHDVDTLPAAAYCEMAIAAARTVLGDDSEVGEISFEQMLLLGNETPVSTIASALSPNGFGLTVESRDDGEVSRHAAAVLRPADGGRPADYDISQLLRVHSEQLAGDELRTWFDARGIHYGHAFTGLAAAHTSDEPSESVLAEVALPGSIRSQQGAYDIHPALLDVCFQAVAAHPTLYSDPTATLMVPLGVSRLRRYGSTRNARFCYARLVGLTATHVEADLDVLDAHGTVLLEVHGLRLGTGVSQSGHRDRLLNQRLLTVEWTRQQMPAAEHAAVGPWMIISTGETADRQAVKLVRALKLRDAEVTSVAWHPRADHAVMADLVQNQLSADVYEGVIVVTAPDTAAPDERCAVRACEAVRHLVRTVRILPEILGEPPHLYVVTRCAQTVLPDDVANLDLGGLRGMLRAIAIEHPGLRVTQIDLDERTPVGRVAHQVLSGSEEDETAWRSGEWYTARLNLTPLRADERRTRVVSPEQDGMRLQIRAPGDIESLELVGFERVPPGPGQIEVSVAASSVNFADVLVAYGRYPSFEGRLPQLGADFAGVITAVGPGVTEHRVGDRVAGISANGAWSTFVACDADLVVSIPDGMPANRAAAVPSAHATAWYSLHDLARVSPGDKVLIHSATGGVGQAAIAIARAAGAEIFATAGSLWRRELLHSMGIDYVYDSRTTDFADLIRRDTDGYGVDIVLNSLPGAAQRAGIELLSFGGRFIEIGKRDIYGDTRLPLLPFRRNLAFHAVDLALLTLTNPSTLRGVLQTVYTQISAGSLPLPETSHYPLREGGTAIRVMSAAEHTGKLVLDIPHTGQVRVAVPPDHAKVFRADGSYIITGGLGGLGLFLAEKMAVAGCGRLVLNGRSEPTPEAARVIEQMRCNGTDVIVECGDIADPDTADRLVVTATATGMPVRGVLHAAAVVEDATLANITDDLVNRNWAPKVHGAWNLHHSTLAEPLDWFCSFSSAAAMVGSPGQAAYAAANSWLDSFSHWRRAQGLPATAIAWGAWAEIGRGQGFAADAGMAISPDDGAYAFEVLLRHDRGYTGYAPVSGTPWLTAFAQSSKFAEGFKAMGPGHATANTFLAELHDLPQDEWPGRLRRLIGDQIGLILRRAVDPDRPLSEYGLDSLGVLEVRTRIETATGVRVSAMDITTVRALADSLYRTLVADEAASATV